MAILAGVNYDPGTAVSKATDTLIAMTALDTTNLRLTFTAPSSGIVLVRLRGNVSGSTTFPRILLGVLDGATIKLRMSPFGSIGSGLATSLVEQEILGIVSGLTGGNSYTWDAAYGVEIVAASTNLKYGGPDDASGADAWGGFVFEVWETTNLLAATSYDPSTAVSKAATALRAMTALDTTNLRLTFTAPASGKVFWRCRGQFHGASTHGAHLLGILEGSTVVARAAPMQGQPETLLATTCLGLDASGIITGLSAGSHTYDAAYATQVVAGTNGALKYGGPDNATTNDAFGAFCFEIWSC